MNAIPYLNPKTGYKMVTIPSGEAVYGTGPEDPYFEDAYAARERPQFKADIPEFYMGACCVTNEQYFEFVRDTGYRAPECADCCPPVWKDGEFQREKARHPVVCVSWDDAKAYCEWAGLLLPTELQWEKAARGCDGRRYPWGDEWAEEKCRNLHNAGSGTTCAVDDYPEGCSVFRVFNMSGNIWEWCEDSYDADAYERYSTGDLRLPNTGQEKILRGGSWHGDTPIPFRCAARLNRPAYDRSPYTGFRCARGTTHEVTTAFLAPSTST